MNTRHRCWSVFLRLLVPVFLTLSVVGCRQKVVPASDDISICFVAVLRRPDPSFKWSNERDALRLTVEEKEVIQKYGLTGDFEVVLSGTRGQGSREVRVVIIQERPLAALAKIRVPSHGSTLYVQTNGVLKQLGTNSSLSSFVAEIMQEGNITGFSFDDPRAQVRFQGALFWWDKDGNWYQL
jgi:hypothetical protein